MSSSIIKRNFSTTAKNAIRNVTVIGGGLMGSGIAQVTAQAGQNVTLVEINEDLIQKARTSIVTSLTRVAKKLYKDRPSEGEAFIKNAQSRIKTSTNPSEAVRDADLVIEAIIENIDNKHELFKTLDKAAPAKTLFASNTSSLSIGEIASVTNRKDKFGGLHFFNPVPVMKLLEVVRIPETSDETYTAFMEWGKSIGKTCITCKDTPGFVVNRLLIPYKLEALRMYERGDASFEDIDTAMKLGAGYPMGPFELSDYTGLDLSKHILEDKMVSEGKLGRKSGEGFYKYKK
ncbi:hypothetical protein Trydic_g14365 [Trypoxylus dichotomus]